MSTENKIDNAAEKAKGAVKEAVGHVTGDDSTRREGELDQAKADLKQSGEKIKDALHD